MDFKEGNLRSLIFKTMLPVALGIGVVIWLFLREFDLQQWYSIPWTARTFGALALCLLFIAGRESGMAWRFRALTDRQLTWRQSFKVTMQAEFVSAITPTSAGGSTLSMILMGRQGIPLGRGTIIAMIILMLDEMFFVIFCPLLFLFIPGGAIFGFDHGSFNIGVRVAFWIIYGVIAAIALLLYLGAFVFPHRIGNAIKRLFGLRLLRRWRSSAVEMAETMASAGTDLRKRNRRWWSEAVCATVLSWCCRYLVVNMLFWGFSAAAPQAVVFARQFVIWTILSISPTPGGAGLSEWIFTGYYGDLIADASMILVIAILWRLLTYYIYLFYGAVRLPSWLRRKQ